jgi:hypothetical protein
LSAGARYRGSQDPASLSRELAFLDRQLGLLFLRLDGFGLVLFVHDLGRGLGGRRWSLLRGCLCWLRGLESERVIARSQVCLDNARRVDPIGDVHYFFGNTHPPQGVGERISARKGAGA